MKYVSAYLLSTLGGKSDPAASDLKNIFDSVGVEFDQTNADTIVKLLNGKSIEEVISTGMSKLASVPSGGGAAAASSAPAAASGGGGGAAPAEEKKKKEEVKEESDEDMGFGLFD